MTTPLDEFRTQKDAFFRRNPQSPLEPNQRSDFHGLAYFPENAALALEVDVEPLENPDDIQMMTSTGDVATYRRWGRFSFEVDGEKAELTIYQADAHGGLFLPFADATSGKDSYGAGRYLEPQLQDDGKVLVDLNYAYNPYCAYNEHWSCPIPPAENRLAVPIRAGEKNFPGGAHSAAH